MAGGDGATELLPLVVPLGESSRPHRRGLADEAVSSDDRAVPIDGHGLRRRRRHLLPWAVAVLGVAAAGRVDLAAVGREADGVAPVIGHALRVKALARGLVRVRVKVRVRVRAKVRVRVRARVRVSRPRRQRWRRRLRPAAAAPDPVGSVRGVVHFLQGTLPTGLT